MSDKLFHSIGFRECKQDYMLFYEWRESTTRWSLRRRYEPFACPECGKFDPREAVKAGFDEDVVATPPKQTEAFITNDSQGIISDTCLELFNKVIPNGIRSWRINDSIWHFAMPKTLYLPTSEIIDDSPVKNQKTVLPAFRHDDPQVCKSCGRYYSLQIDQGRMTLRANQKLVPLVTLFASYRGWLLHA